MVLYSRRSGIGTMGLPPGVQLFRGYLDGGQQEALYAEIMRVVEVAPFYVPSMPNSGRPFSVSMTNCGSLGWHSDKFGGYRYQQTHPVTGEVWPAIPRSLLKLWRDVANFADPPEACLINLYRGKARLGSHVDRDEQVPEAPVVSVSLGDDAIFHIGGPRRTDPRFRVLLKSGDVLRFGEASRFAYHGLDRVEVGTSELLPGGGRINLTLRRVTRDNPAA